MSLSITSRARLIQCLIFCQTNNIRTFLWHTQNVFTLADKFLSQVIRLCRRPHSDQQIAVQHQPESEYWKIMYIEYWKWCFQRGVYSEEAKICVCPKSELPEHILRGQGFSRRTQESPPDRVSNSVQDSLDMPDKDWSFHVLDPRQGLIISWISKHNGYWTLSKWCKWHSRAFQPNQVKLRIYKPRGAPSMISQTAWKDCSEPAHSILPTANEQRLALLWISCDTGTAWSEGFNTGSMILSKVTWQEWDCELFIPIMQGICGKGRSSTCVFWVPVLQPTQKFGYIINVSLHLSIYIRIFWAVRGWGSVASSLYTMAFFFDSFISSNKAL